MDKKKPSPIEINDLNTVAETITENRLFQWSVKHSKNIAYFLMLASVLLFYSYRSSANNSNQAEADYFNAQNDFQIFSGQTERSYTDEERSEALENLQTILARRPELKTKYQALIAQTLLIQGKALESQKLMDHVYKRTAANQLPLYTDFTKNSLLIGQGEFTRALDEAMTLDEKIAAEASSKYANLRIYNLLRIALLQQQLGNAAGELQAWKNFKAYALDSQTASSNLDEHTASLMMQNLFSEGNATIGSYIETREAQLNRELGK